MKISDAIEDQCGVDGWMNDYPPVPIDLCVGGGGLGEDQREDRARNGEGKGTQNIAVKETLPINQS